MSFLLLMLFLNGAAKVGWNRPTASNISAFYFFFFLSALKK